MTGTTKGFLPPRLTTVQRDAIVAPATGLSIYNITKNCLEWYNSTVWYNGCGDNGVGIATSYSCNTAISGEMKVGVPVSGVAQTITATVTVLGSYNISTATVNWGDFFGVRQFG